MSRNLFSRSSFGVNIVRRITIPLARLSLTLSLLFSLAASVLPASSTQASSINILYDNLGADGEVDIYEKFEVTFTVNRPYSNPFDPDDIDVEGCFLEPGKAYDLNCTYGIEQKGFIYQAFTISYSTVKPDEEIYTEYGKPVWMIRFTPQLPGEYRYFIRARKNNDSGDPTPLQSFSVSTQKKGSGFIGVSKKNPAYFAFFEREPFSEGHALVEGKPFIGIGLNIGWWGKPTQRKSYYEYYLQRMGEFGANLARVWMSNSVRKGDASTPGDWLSAEKVLSIQDTALGADYDLVDAWAFDQILQNAEDKGIFLILTLENTSAFSGDNWDQLNLYKSQSAGDGLLASPFDFFEPPAKVLAYQEQVLRYIIARWGYSPNILSWELFNEVDEFVYNTPDEKNLEDENPYNDKSEAEVWANMEIWHEAMADTIDLLDKYDHLINTSTGSFNTGMAARDFSIDKTNKNLVCENQGESSLYNLSKIDFAEMHTYYVEGGLRDTNIPTDELGQDITTLIRYYTDRIRGSVDGQTSPGQVGQPLKPVLVGEFGLTGYNFESRFDIIDKEDAGLHLHNGLWASLMSGGATSALNWHWSLHRIMDVSWWRHYAPLANFFAGFEELPLADLKVMKPLKVMKSIDETPCDVSLLEAEFYSLHENLRAMGLRSGQMAYVWIQNKNSTWDNYVSYQRNFDKITDKPGSEYFYVRRPTQTPGAAQVKVFGFTPNTAYTVDWWDTYQTDSQFQVIRTQLLRTNGDGDLLLTIDNFQSIRDIAVKIRPASAALEVRKELSSYLVEQGEPVTVSTWIYNRGSVELDVSVQDSLCGPQTFNDLLPGEEQHYECGLDAAEKDLAFSSMATAIAGNIRLERGDIKHLNVLDGVVGDGYADSCTELAFRNELVNSGKSKITFNCGNMKDHKYTIFLTGLTEAEQELPRDLTIDGSYKTSSPELDGTDSPPQGGSIALSGSNLRRIFTVPQGLTLTLENLTLRSGSAHRAIEDPAYNEGGGAIRNRGTLNVNNSLFYANWADFGGAIHNANKIGVAHLKKTFFWRNRNNMPDGGDGGAIFNANILTATEGSAFYDNSARGGGAILNWDIGSTDINNVEFVGNRAVNGGAIENGETSVITLIDSTFAGNSATWQGGAIANFDQGRIEGSTTSFNRNSAVYGGGICNLGFGDVTVSDDLFLSNKADQGGGLFNDGVATLTNIGFEKNTAYFAGGAFYNAESGELFIQQNAKIDGNKAKNDDNNVMTQGGALYNLGITSITGGTLAGNQARDGGGIYIKSGSVTLASVGITASSATYGHGGGVMMNGGTAQFDQTTIAGNDSSGSGGGVALWDGALTFNNSAVTENFAQSVGGGISVTGGSLDLVNSTISTNQAGQQGGGLYQDGGSMRVESATIARNTGLAGGGLFISSGTATFHNIILASNQFSPGGAHPECSGTQPISSAGYNLLGSNEGCNWIAGTGDQVGTGNSIDPRLGPLANNGGPTQTHALQFGSPAVDAGDPTSYLPSDQRGTDFGRPWGPRADIGAFELRENPPSYWLFAPLVSRNSSP